MTQEQVVEILKTLGLRDAISIDTEYQHNKGEHVIPVCLCAKSLFTGQEWRLLSDVKENPPPMDDDVLYITFAAHAEWSYFLSMAWELPPTIIDLYAERQMATREERGHDGKMIYPSLLSSMMHYKLDAMSAVHKTEMRDLIMGRGNTNDMIREGLRPYASDTEGNNKLILDYCMEDVKATEKLFVAMFTELAECVAQTITDQGRPGDDDASLPSCAEELFDIALKDKLIQWITRGNYTRAVAYWEYNGIPVDVPAYERLVRNRKVLQNKLVKSVEDEYHFGAHVQKKNGDMSFNKAGFNALVARHGLQDEWPLSPSGKDFSSADEVFKEMARRYPDFKPLYDVRKFVLTLRSFELFIGPDGRSRVFPDPFHTNTGRNNPRNSNFLFTLPKWARPLMKPGPGRALIYSDLKSAEIGIAAGLSRDANMMKTYSDSLLPGGVDCYVGFAKLAGAIPENGTKESHPKERKLYKSSFLGANYGQTPEGFALHNDLPLRVAQAVHGKHHTVYAQWWAWIENEIITAGVLGHMDTKWGWVRQVSPDDAEANTLLNFPIQAGCAEIMRLASGYMIDEGIILCCCVHDAVLVECALGEEDDTMKTCDECWRRASAAYLDGFELGSDAKIVAYPARWGDNHEEDAEDFELWGRIQKLLDKIEAEAPAPEVPTQAILELSGESR
jgi:DNA polymerase-1